MNKKVISFFFLASLFFSCQKELSINSVVLPGNPTAITDSLTVKSIKLTRYGTGDPDSVEIDYFYLDTISNKIRDVLKFSGDNFTDSFIRVSSYDSNKQLISVEEDGLPVIKFTRDLTGKLISSTTYYQGAMVAQSTGTFEYGNQGLNQTITFLDSTLKFNGSDVAQAFYKVTLPPGDIVQSYEEFSIAPVRSYKKDTYVYDINNNLISILRKDTMGIILYSASFLNEPNRSFALSTFFKRLGGDLFWFYQPDWFLIYEYSYALNYPIIQNAPKKITYSAPLSNSNYTNSYDIKGNLISMVERNDSGELISKIEIAYN